ncbi:MAG: YdcF family protein [Acidobacteria bacterium]|nr:YdcF family protein [Acidobacteriota bacterium]
MSWKLKILISALILFVGWIFLAPLLARNLIVDKPLKRADAIVVLSGSRAYVERTHRAAGSYKEGVANRVILTDDGEFAGWSQAEQRNPKFVELAEKELIAQGVSADDIEILKPEVSGTIYEARLIKKKIDEEKWKSILLVTSGYHSGRALWSFQKTIGDKSVEIGVVSAKSKSGIEDDPAWWLRPRGWRLVAGEYVKFIGYWLFY